VSLSVISGPPGSGREEAILDRFEEATRSGAAMLVVPTRDDVDRIERGLARRGSAALLGGTVTTLPGLFGEVARATGTGAPATAARMQRVWLARAAAARARLRILRRSAARPGFAPALESLIADLQAAGLDAAALLAAVEAGEGDGAYEREICALFAAYEELRDGAGLTDQAEVDGAATAALRASPGAWGERPVLLLGFDDLARRQLELVDALAGACPVTIAITFEADRPALAARAALRGVLVDELGAGAEPPLPHLPPRGDALALHHLERNLFEPDPPAAEPDGSIRLLEGAGERNEAELIGRRIAMLLAEGTEPDDVAVAVRSPDRQAPLIARVLAGLGIPVAPEARVPLASTATGATVLRLLAIAGPDGTAADVVAFLRGPARAHPRSVDWLERRVLRDRLTSAGDAIEAWRGGEERDRRIWELDALAEAGEDPASFGRALGRIAAHVAERPHLRSGFVPSGGASVELRAAAEIERTLAETVALGGGAPRPGEVAELLEHVRVPLWTGSTQGRVRILSPYRLRATRLRHLFVAALSDGSFPARVPGDPLLADDRRGALGLTPRTDQAAEERFLFYSCVSLPDECLHLSYPASDEAGVPTPRSAFVDEVRSLLAPAPAPDAADDEVEAEIATRAAPDEVVPRPEAATTPRDLARALAARGGAATELEGLALPPRLTSELGASLAAAGESLAAATAPGPLSHPDVLAELAADRPYGASTLEEYDTCPYRWFVSHELDPRPLGPDPEALEDGGLVHEVLERIYKSPPTGKPRPLPEDCGRWAEAARDLVREVAAERGWRLESANARIRIARFDAVIARFLRRDAETGGPLQPDPELLEASFGRGPDDRFDAVDLGGFSLHGRIDRIDVTPQGQALIRDYKLSSKAVAGAKLIEEGKLQMPLYLLAAREFGLDPIGGLYSPLAGTTEDRPRGLLDKDHKGTLLPDETAAAVRNDFLEHDEFEETLDAARKRARAIVDGMRAGAVKRAPRKDECPKWCGFAPICRIERGTAVEDPEAEEDAAA
jgi:RecB family exonuclease